jgi:thiamine-monophosphate kinase
VDEIARVALLARLLGRAADGVEVGIGDDAAVLAGTEAGAKLVWTIDEQVEGTHFRRDLLSMQDIGWRSFIAAVSDVAAMGARPWCALSALVLPDDVDDAALEELVRGQAEAAMAAKAPVVGGNLARGPALSIATTVLGRAQKPVLRSGARAGDGLWLAGSVGLAAAGFRALERGLGSDSRLAAAVAAWRRPVALVDAGMAMASVAHAAVDVSDGLARDAGHLAEASGVRALLDQGALASEASLRDVALALGEDPVDLALHGGEDYALLVASPVAIEGFRRVGEVRQGQGLVLRTPTGEAPVEPRGFDHFRKA